MYFIQLMATKRCNQNCYYCTTLNRTDKKEVDIDYLKWCLDQCPNDLSVELTGGEIGLLSNLDDFYKTVKDHKNVSHIKALSNGLIRFIGVDWLKDVEYWEHLIYEIDGKDIKKFYNLDLNQSHRYVIVTTQKTTKSLLSNLNYFKDIGILEYNFFYKLMNHKSNLSIKNYFNDLCKLYSKLNDENHRYFEKMLLYYFSKNRLNYPDYLKKQKLLCQKYPPNIYIDLQTRQLGHCAMNVNTSIKVEFNKDNLIKMMNGKINDNSYCQNCYSFDNGRNRSAKRNRSYEQ